jgi:hypothetical protein
VFPDAKQLYTAFAAVGREALVASGALTLPRGQLFVADGTPVPVAPLHFDVHATHEEVNRVDLQEHLTFKLETVCIKPSRDTILKAANASLTYEPLRELGDHFRGCFIKSIPSMETLSTAKHPIVVIYP